jgi:hypothetical protein
MGENSSGNGSFALSVLSETIRASEESIAPSREIRIILPSGNVITFDRNTISRAINSAFHAVKGECAAANSQTLETIENRRC